MQCSRGYRKDYGKRRLVDRNKMWKLLKDENALAGLATGIETAIGRAIIGQTGVIGMIGSWLGA